MDNIRKLPEAEFDVMVALWDYAIKRNLIIDFPVGRFHEDFSTMPLMIFNAKTMVCINKYEYHYVQTDKSIMRNNPEDEKSLPGNSVRDVLRDSYGNLWIGTDNGIAKYNEKNDNLYYFYIIAC